MTEKKKKQKKVVKIFLILTLVLYFRIDYVLLSQSNI